MDLERESSASPGLAIDQEPAGDDDRRRMKRDRESAYGPSTPKGDEESKVLGALTPLAKKGRVQPTSGPSVYNRGSNSDTESQPADDDNPPPHSTVIRDSTPPGLVEPSSAPGTPIVLGRSLPAKGEGTETRNIRQRVEALEWDDETQAQQQLSSVAAAAGGEDSEIADVAADVWESAAQVQAKDQEDAYIAEVAVEVAASAQRLDEGVKDVEIAETAGEVTNSAQVVDQRDLQDVEIANTADEVAHSASRLDEGASAVQVAEVASEVSDTAARLDSQDGTQGNSVPNGAEIAEVAADVGSSAVLVDALDENMAASAKVSTEVADSAVIAAEEDVTDPEKEPTATSLPSSKIHDPPASSPFTSFSSTASPFASFSSSASPFATVPSARVPPPPPQKPKAKTNFSSIPSLPPSSSISISSPPVTPRPLVSSASLKSDADRLPPVSPSLKTSTVAPASSFTAFSSSSGFSATPSTSGFGSYSAATTASPFAKVQASAAPSQTPSRKLGDPVENDPDRRVFTEQEVVTGEEDDDTIHSVRCKLFVMSKGSWVERGTGVLKLNITRGAGRRGARLVMRADATHRLLLNAVLFPKFSIELFQEKYVRFAIIEAGEPVSYMLRLGGTPTAQALVGAVHDRVSLLD